MFSLTDDFFDLFRLELDLYWPVIACAALHMLLENVAAAALRCCAPRDFLPSRIVWKIIVITIWAVAAPVHWYFFGAPFSVTSGDTVVYSVYCYLGRYFLIKVSFLFFIVWVFLYRDLHAWGGTHRRPAATGANHTNGLSTAQVLAVEALAAEIVFLRQHLRTNWIRRAGARHSRPLCVAD